MSADIDDALLRKVAELSKLDISPENFENTAREFRQLISFVETVAQANAQALASSSALDLTKMSVHKDAQKESEEATDTHWRADNTVDGLEARSVVKAAAESNDTCFVVPLVVGD